MAVKELLLCSAQIHPQNWSYKDPFEWVEVWCFLRRTQGVTREKGTFLAPLWVQQWSQMVSDSIIPEWLPSPHDDEGHEGNNFQSDAKADCKELTPPFFLSLHVRFEIFILTKWKLQSVWNMPDINCRMKTIQVTLCFQLKKKKKEHSRKKLKTLHTV